MKPSDFKGQNILVAADMGVFIGSLSDISDAIGKCFGADGITFTESDLTHFVRICNKTVREGVAQ
jgi:hypothetical protein